jgi:DNA-directed RNA polymerase specialized sigma24 family protein
MRPENTTAEQRKLGLGDEDAADLVQDVLVVLVRKMAQFQYQPSS